MVTITVVNTRRFWKLNSWLRASGGRTRLRTCLLWCQLFVGVRRTWWDWAEVATPLCANSFSIECLVGDSWNAHKRCHHQSSTYQVLPRFICGNEVSHKKRFQSTLKVYKSFFVFFSGIFCALSSWARRPATREPSNFRHVPVMTLCVDKIMPKCLKPANWVSWSC